MRKEELMNLVRKEREGSGFSCYDRFQSIINTLQDHNYNLDDVAGGHIVRTAFGFKEIELLLNDGNQINL